MPFQPADNLTNRTFVGLIIAQFLAGFNDQAIHAAAMFYAIHTRILSQANAITLMPILFYAPWAIFCTLAGYYADRYSKTMTLRLWKISEIGIALLLTVGFYFGTNEHMPRTGGWIVMSCVFLMGTHAAFFAPAKYGAMPEILRSDILSRGNGILESTTFLASILGTVSGGLLFNAFRNNEVWIGVVLLVLSIVGAVASFMIVWLPAASPDKLFPTNLVKPLVENLKVMFRSRPLALAVLGIAFFVFMVAYMRASMYMHGETRNPRWDEEKTSLIVATVALGVGLGSPLAGYLSGGKVELGLVPLGCLGMIFALLISALAIEHTAILVVALILIGFCSGFYMVPLYTLLQQRAPKKSKGELVATSNFINVTGAIAASILFNVLVQLGRLSGVTAEIPTQDVAVGILTSDPIVVGKHGKIKEIEVYESDKDDIIRFNAKSTRKRDIIQDLIDGIASVENLEPVDVMIIDFDDDFFDVLSGIPQKDDKVIVSSYQLRGVQHYMIRKAEQLPRKIYDNEILPRFLFLGAALMTVGILFLLWRKLPDFFVRSLFWYQALGKIRLKVVHMQNLPTEGPVILVSRCQDLRSCLELVAATDRSTKVILVETPASLQNVALLRWLALRQSIVTVRPDAAGKITWGHAEQVAVQTLQQGHLLALSVANEEQASALDALLQELRQLTQAPVLPVFCGALASDQGVQRIRVVYGELRQGMTLAECKCEIDRLGEWIRANDALAIDAAH